MKQTGVTYTLFKYLWILAILPKPVQFVGLLGYAVLMIVNDNGKFYYNTVSLLFYLCASVQILAIIFNFPGQNMSRIFAAVNTVLIWFIAVTLYGHFRNAEIDLVKVGKYFTTNIVIIIFLGLLMVVLQIVGIDNVSFLRRSLTVSDWQDGLHTLRLVAFLEYPNLVIIFILEQLPLALMYLKTKINSIGVMLFTIFAMIPTILSHSRAGIIAVGIVVLIVVFDGLQLGQSDKRMLVLFSAVAMVGVVIALHQQIESIISSILTSRQGSTSMRESIYQTSIDVTLKESPLIGNGIKSEFQGYPLGSHSTFIGMFYKTGILGSLAALSGFVVLFQTLFYTMRSHRMFLTVIGTFGALLLFLIFEDIDGAEWSLIVFWSVMGLLTNKPLLTRERI